MSAITIAMPRMVPNQLLAEAHAKYPESLACICSGWKACFP